MRRVRYTYVRARTRVVQRPVGRRRSGKKPRRGIKNTGGGCARVRATKEKGSGVERQRKSMHRRKKKRRAKEEKERIYRGIAIFQNFGENLRAADAVAMTRTTSMDSRKWRATGGIIGCS